MVGGEIDKVSSNVKPRVHMARSFGQTCRSKLSSKKKQPWAEEKPKFDNARKLTEIFEIDPEDMEFKKTMTSAGKVVLTWLQANTRLSSRHKKAKQFILQRSWTCATSKL